MGTELPDRKGNRLKGYDYSARGVYFVTICTQNRVCNLGSVVGADARIGPHDGLNPDVHIELSPLGRIAEQALLQMDGLLHYVIMPNHIHFWWASNPKRTGRCKHRPLQIFPRLSAFLKGALLTGPGIPYSNALSTTTSSALKPITGPLCNKTRSNGFWTHCIRREHHEPV